MKAPHRTPSHVVHVSGGWGSFRAAEMTIEKHGRDATLLLFCDTMMESDGLYRFLADTVAYLRMQDRFVRIADGRNPWQVYRDERFLGNSRRDPCSKILKRQLGGRWVRDNAPNSVQVLGLGWDEPHRIDGSRRAFAAKGLETWFPLADEVPGRRMPTRQETLLRLQAAGVRISPMYKLGFAHDNCGGFCCKAGQGHFAHLLEHLPTVYAQHEAEEQATIAHIGRDDIGILLDRRGGQKRPMTLRDFRERVQAGDIKPDKFDIGGCGCYAPTDPDEEFPM